MKKRLLVGLLTGGLVAGMLPGVVSAFDPPDAKDKICFNPGDGPDGFPGQAGAHVGIHPWAAHFNGPSAHSRGRGVAFGPTGPFSCPS